MLTKQEIFTKAWLGLKGQRFQQAMDSRENGICAYRGVGDRKCAVGQCIPDELYHPAMDDQDLGGTGIFKLVERFPQIRRLFGKSKQMLNFLSALQSAHDSNDDPEEMERALRLFAKRRRLQIPE